MSSQGSHLAARTTLIACLTLISRVLGLVRDVVSAGFFGTTFVFDAFSFAFRVPNLFRKLFAEGALGAAFIPVFTEYVELREPEQAWRLAGRVAAALGLVLLLCLVVGELIVFAIPCVAELSERWRLALALTAVMLPYMALICLASLAGGILNSLRHFFAPAFAPVLLNLCWIGAVVGVAPLVTRDASGRVFVLAGGIVVAGLFQLALQLAALRRRGFCWRIALDLADPGLRRIVRGMGPVLVGLAAFQLNVLLDGVLALSLSAPAGKRTFVLLGLVVPYPMREGATSVLYFANRLMQFPLGVFGIALATAAFPTLSAIVARKDWRAFSATLTHALRMGAFIAIPAGAGLALLAMPTVALLFQRGRFTADSASRTAVVLMTYCAGVPAYCAQQLLVRAFYALQDTRTPMRIALLSVGVNLTLNLLLVWPLAECGLAAATAISAALQVVLLYVILCRRGRLEAQREFLTTLVKSAGAAAVMAAVIIICASFVPRMGNQATLGMRAAGVFAPMAAGLVAYLAAAHALGCREVKGLLRTLARRRKVQ